MTTTAIIAIVVVTVITDWLVSPKMRRYFRARRRRRALARRPSPEVEAERLLQLRHWQAMAADSRRRMLEATSYEIAYAENDHARAQAKIRELSRKP